MVVVWPKFIDFISGKYPIRAITLFPFIILSSESDLKDPFLINHEQIHLRQQLELLIIPFYLWYLIEYLIKLLKTGSWYMGYHQISFEGEAKYNEQNLYYLSERQGYSFLDYL